jgi:hypothetical protein
LVSLLTAISLCGGGFDAAGVHSALAADLPVTTSLTAGDFVASFSGDDASLSFEVTFDPLLGSFTSGGGWIPLGTGGKGTFGVIGMVQAGGTFAGHVVYIDHDTGFTFQSTSITDYIPGCTSVIQGTFGNLGAFSVIVTDNGEPGTADTFTIVATGYQGAAGILGGGDIQAHGPSCP